MAKKECNVGGFVFEEILVVDTRVQYLANRS